MTINPDQIYVPAEVAEILRCGKTNVYALLKQGDLASTSISAGKKGMRIRGSDLLVFLKERTTGGPIVKGTFKHIRDYVK